MFWLPAIAAAAAVAGSALGSAGKRKSLSKREKFIGGKKQENENWYNRRYNEDATQRADSLRLLNLADERIKRRDRAAAGRAAVMGGTQESVAAEKEANNEMMANAIGQIAAANEKRKDAIEQQYLNRNERLDDALYEIESNKDSGLDIAGNMFGAVGSALGSFSGGGLEGLGGAGKTTPSGATTAATAQNPNLITVRKQRR